MRTRAARAGMACGTLLIFARLLGGCVVDSANDCNATGTCPDTSTTTTSTTGTTTSTTTVPAGCIDFADGDPVSPTCGVFVSPQGGSDDTGTGAQDAPFATLGKALGAAPKKPIYVCAGDLAEALVVTADTSLLGGFSCSDWTYTGDKPALAAPKDAVALTVDAGVALVVHDLAISSQTPSKKGESSIALLVRDGADLDLARVDVTAGDGAPGEDGVTPVDVGPNDEGKSGADGMPGMAGCVSMTALLGGSGGLTTCGGTSTSGGLGGAGTTSTGGDGSAGEPAGGTGVGGAGAKVGVACVPGGPGSPGMTGDPGGGAKGLGALTSEGFTGAAGEAGATGTPGQGGGGGGGGKVCGNNAGPSGGGGGAGGCGGAGGGAGKAGGSSIGIASHQAASLTLSSVKITTGKGGLGGAGALGQEGGFGGNLGALGGQGACPGGLGGSGGLGGPGGGGAGGHSIGVAWTQTAPTLDATVFTQSDPGNGGAGGPGNEIPGTGESGASADTLEVK